MISFSAEVIKCEVKKTVSNDKEYKVYLVTSDPRALLLQEFINEDIIQVEVTPERR